MAASRCTRSSRDLFIFILCVACLSVLFNFQISYYGSTFVDQRQQQPLDEVLQGQVVREQNDGYDVKILGRSLNQHQTDLLKSRSTEKFELVTKLNEIENRLLRAKHHVIALKGDESKISGDNVSHGIKHLDIRKTQKNDNGLSWVDKDTIVQGNWSVLLCFDKDKCPMIQADISQKIDRIPAIIEILETPEAMCSISKNVENDGQISGQCELFRCNSTLNDSTLLVTGNSVHYNTTSNNFCQKQDDSLRVPLAYIWYLPDKPILFPKGPVLRLHGIVTSVFPLRFYVHPEMLTGPFTAMEHPSLFRKLTIEDLLQYVSEVYGLGVSSRWWMEVKKRLLLYFVHLEQKILSFKNFGKCRRCFQFLNIDVVCSSVQHCQVIQISNGDYLSPDVMTSIYKLVTSRLEVSEDIERVLKHRSLEICGSSVLGDQEDHCISENNLIYLIDWRREMKSYSEFIAIYPSDFGCKELSKEDAMIAVKSDTVNFNSMTGNIGNAFLWTDKPSSLMDEDNDDYVDTRLTKHRKYVTDTATPCSIDPQDCGKIDEIVIHPNVVLEEISHNHYNGTVGYNTIIVRIGGISRSCNCQVKIENKYNDPGARNITLGLGDTRIMLYIVDTSSQDMNVVKTVTISIKRQDRGLTNQQYDGNLMKVCGLKQDCSLKFDKEAKCGLIDLNRPWSNEKGYSENLKRCTSGDHEGQWVVPCRSCSNENECLWENAKWEPRDCQYDKLSASFLKQCLQGKKLLFIGDSTNRGVSNYIIEQINGSLYDWDKTHSTRIYSNINQEKTQFTFAYYPHFWLPADHRPKFSKVIYQLIKSSLPLENNSNTVFVVGGVQWLAKQHIDLIIDALERKGLSGITKAIKGLGAGFHQPVENVRYVPKSEHVHLQQREADILTYAKTKGFHAVSTFNMTISRYKDFLEGNCACHFHKVNKHGSQRDGFYYTVEGKLNAVYSQILLNQICQVPLMKL